MSGTPPRGFCRCESCSPLALFSAVFSLACRFNFRASLGSIGHRLQVTGPPRTPHAGLLAGFALQSAYDAFRRMLIGWRLTPLLPSLFTHANTPPSSGRYRPQVIQGWKPLPHRRAARWSVREVRVFLLLSSGRPNQAAPSRIFGLLCCCCCCCGVAFWQASVALRVAREGETRGASRLDDDLFFCADLTSFETPPAGLLSWAKNLSADARMVGSQGWCGPHFETAIFRDRAIFVPGTHIGMYIG